MRWALGGLALLAASCHAAGGPGGYALYPKLGEGPGPAKVAMLRGPIAFVDGRGVSAHGMTFELLPGCHVVTVERNVGAGNANGAWSANLPRIVYAFEMKAAHIYTVETRFNETSGPWGHVNVVAQEHAPNGTVVRVPSARAVDVADCRHWATAQGL